MEPYSWTCPYCGKPTTITAPNVSRGLASIQTEQSRFGSVGLNFCAIACPNVDCKELSLDVHLRQLKKVHSKIGENTISLEVINSWKLMPRSRALPQPDYIPKEIRENYKEACLILEGSPKASAAMSRRCLQGMVRDFWQLPSNKRGNLGAELSQIKDKVDHDTWASITAVREIGDIGAHMEKDVDLIIDIEPHEAELLVDLIENLFEGWYVTRKKREDRSAKLVSVAKSKKQDKQDGKNKSSIKKDNENS